MNKSTIDKYTPKILFSTLLICIVVSAVVIQSRNMGWFQQWDLMAYDVLLNQSISKNKETKNKYDDNVIIVGITEEDIQRRKEWPLSDLSLAQLIASIQKNSPTAIGIDIYRDMLIAPGSDRLIETLNNNLNIFLVEKFSSDGATSSIRPNELLVDEPQTGFSDMLVDDDGVVRRGLLFLNDSERLSYALSLRLAATHLATKQIRLGSDPDSPENLMFGSVPYKPIEKDDGGYVNLDAGGYQYFLSLSYGQPGFRIYTMDEILNNKINPEMIRGKVVIIGVISDSVKDIFLTPLNTKNGINMIPGVVLHAHATSQLIDSGLNGSKPLRVYSNERENIWIMIWAFLGLMFAIISTSIFRYVLFFSFSLFVLVASTSYLFNTGVWLPIVAPVSVFLDVFLLISGYVYIQEKKQRDMVMELFSRHVSADVANEVWSQRDDFFKDGRLKSQQATATILFTDLVGYTSTAEKLDPEALMTWLNDYMEIMANCVIKHGGMIDDYYGDAIKANFGVPLIRDSEELYKQDAQNAIECALEMNQQMHTMNENRLADNLPAIGMRVGIATGVVIVGSLGSRQRLKYTSIGDVVNVAARLESYGREVSSEDSNECCSILLAESTKKYLDEKYETREIGELKLKGKTEGLKAYQLLTNEVKKNVSSD